MGTSLTDEMVTAALAPLDDVGPTGSGVIGDDMIVALRLVDVLTGDNPRVDAELYADLRRHFSDGQILELGSALAVASGWQVFIEAFGIRPDGPWLPSADL
jgi:alkylhydroperoxidase family enzyme